MGIKVLFIYPNTYGMNMVPPAIALFSALLKKEFLEKYMPAPIADPHGADEPLVDQSRIL